MIVNSRVNYVGTMILRALTIFVVMAAILYFVVDKGLKLSSIFAILVLLLYLLTTIKFVLNRAFFVRAVLILVIVGGMVWIKQTDALAIVVPCGLFLNLFGLVYKGKTDRL